MTFLKNPVDEKSLAGFFSYIKFQKKKFLLATRSPAASQSESHG